MDPGVENRPKPLYFKLFWLAKKLAYGKNLVGIRPTVNLLLDLVLDSDVTVEDVQAFIDTTKFAKVKDKKKLIKIGKRST